MPSRAMTIVDMMAIPLAVAVEIAAVQAMHDWTYEDWWFAIVQVPFVTILLGIVIKIGLELWRKGECSPFLFGFAAFGPVSIALVCIVLEEFGSLDAFHYFTAGWIWNLAGPSGGLKNTPYFQNILKITSCLMLILSQCLLAALGGWLARRLGITVVRKRSSAGHDLVSSTSPLDPTSRP